MANWFCLSAPALGGYAFDAGLVLIGRFKVGQKLALGLVEVAIGGTAGDLVQFPPPPGGELPLSAPQSADEGDGPS